MKLVVLGLSLSSSWGNGHATTYRALLKAFAERGHDILFLERDMPWYSGEHRDMPDPNFCRLEFYNGVAESHPTSCHPRGGGDPRLRRDDKARRREERPASLADYRDEIASADAVIVGSYVPDGVQVAEFVHEHARGVTAFYDIDTPVTLAKLERGDHEYLAPEAIPRFDLYLSFTGGPTLDRLERQYGSPAARALYCAVDEANYRPVDVPIRWDLSYLGTYSDDRQPTLERLLIEPARRRPDLRFAVAGPQYPEDIDWPDNVERLDHVPPADHAEFYSASRFTLNVTRADMIEAGWAPSVRLFEAAACGTPIVSDVWEGLDELFAPDREIILAEQADDVIAALDREARQLGAAARETVLAEHTAAHRAAELEAFLQQAGKAGESYEEKEKERSAA